LEGPIPCKNGDERFSGAEEGGERLLICVDLSVKNLRGLTPNIDLIGFIGMAEVMP
jgi:hypothetical protein